MDPAARYVMEQTALLLPRPSDMGRNVFIGIDGVDGSGKSMFADELGAVLGAAPPVIRVSLDGFHRVARERYRLGRDSPAGFWQDSYDYGAFHRLVVEPLSPGGSGTYRTASHDLAADALLDGPDLTVAGPAVILVDGIFLHRPELAQVWDASVFLEVSFATSFRRMAVRDGSDPAPEAAANQRYLQGQLRYLAECSPQSRATILIDNNDFTARRIVAASLNGSGPGDTGPAAPGSGHRRVSGRDTV